MKHILSFLFICTFLFAQAQEEILPRGLTKEEKALFERGDFQLYQPDRGITSPPPFQNLRCMAEWEEIQALTIAWVGYPGILKQIVAAAQTETQVIILSEDPQATENYLLSNQGTTALPNLDNVTIVNAQYDSVWMRDYAANPVYGSEVDDLILVDWIYNRPRPNDDASPEAIAAELNIPLYTLTEAPTDLVNTGGNWMSDGFGTAFASELILEENAVNNPYNVTPKSVNDIDAIMTEWLGIDRYIKMTTLPYDGIHHIDMHMKLLDEETLLVGEYPEGIADGPQINANIEYVLNNFQSKWGTPFKVVRIPMPPSTSGLWPSSSPTPGYYRTYSNAVFVNKTVILPTYREEYDTTAIRIWQEALPGYRIVGIDSDNQSEPIIAASGAIHCITHSVGVQDPMLISHQPLPDTDNTIDDYRVEAYINHRSGISNAKLFYKTSLAANYEEVSMTDVGNHLFEAYIPAQPEGTTVYYYVQGTSVSGKVLNRPMPAPEGYWSFRVLGEIVATIEEATEQTFGKVFPNPASELTCIKLQLNSGQEGEIQLFNSVGQQIAVLKKGTFSPGESTHFFDASPYASGSYYLRFSSTNVNATYPLMIK